MASIEKLIERLRALPKDLSFHEAARILKSLEYNEVKTGKTAGSRVRFEKKNGKKYTMHKPHPTSIVRSPDVKRLAALVEEEGSGHEAD